MNLLPLISDHWSNGEIFEAIITRIDVVIGFTVTAMIIFVVGYIALYWWSQTHAVPTVVVILLAAVIFPVVPGVLARAGWILIAFGGAFGLFAVLWVIIR